MTTTVEERLQLGLQQAAERGGLASFKDLDEVVHQLLDFSERLSEIRRDASAVASAYGDEVPVPFTVTSENVAALALLVQEIRADMIEIEHQADAIALDLYGIDGVRRTQTVDVA